MRALVLLLGLAACQPTASGPVTATGRLEAGDPTLASGEWYDGYTVAAREGQWITFRVQAEGFDPYLILRSPTDEQTEVDDSDPVDTSSTQLSVEATASGQWIGVVTSYAPGESGPYTVTYHVTDAPPADLPSDAVPLDDAIQV